MASYEKLGMFYLGKVFDTESKSLTNDYLMYDSKDLVTHAVCVGMTGSGKTGLCIGLLEEAAIDNIPAIVIDPKGDLGNLLLTFPELKGKDFEPWINTDEAQKKDLSPAEFARKQANLWKNGLADWGQDGERIRNFRKAVDLAIYTPGSSAGLPVSIISSFAAPSKEALEDMDLFRERVQTTASSILGLLGIDADPLQSREHILLSNIIENCWGSGKDLDLGQLIQMIQSPPMQRIGVFDIESFYPEKDRFKLAMTLNNLLAAPGFQSWMEGEALDVGQMLYTGSGKPRMSIFSIAHLSDSERMFFVTLLLNQIIGWMRAQSGTTSLRALVYMDEVFGFLPPIGEPPSKRPIMTLLKQARAFGLGVVLATQNPVDLDYKGLSNTGTWFIGRLQTEKDQERLIDGLSSAGGSGLSKKKLKDMIAGLQKRVFLMHNVHEKQPVLFGTRWVLSYLRGPLTRQQIKTLMKDRAEKAVKPAPAAKQKPLAASAGIATGSRPQLPPEIREYFAPVPGTAASAKVVYRPYLIAGGDVHFFSTRHNIAHNNNVAHAIELQPEQSSLSWKEAATANLTSAMLGGQPLDDANFAELPSIALKLKTYNSLDKGYETYVYRNYNLSLWESKQFKLTSQPGESERDFRIRLKEAAHERRDLEMDRIRRKYSTKMKSLDRQINTAQRAIQREEDQYSQKKFDAAISIGSTILGAVFGGRRSRTSISRSARSAGRISKEKRDVERAEAKLADLQERLFELENQLSDELALITEKFDPITETLAEKIIRPKKSDILQRWFGFLWIPFEIQADGQPITLHPNIFQT